MAAAWDATNDALGKNEVAVCDAATGRDRYDFRFPVGVGTQRVALFPDGKRLALACANLTLRIVDLPPPFALIGEPPRPKVWCVAYSPDGKVLVSGDGDGLIRVCDPGAGESRAELRGHRDMVNALAFSPPGQMGDRPALLASGSNDGTVRLWDVGRGRERAVLAAGKGNFVQWLVFSPDGKRLAAGGSDRKVRLWDLSGWHDRGGPPGPPVVLSGHSDWVRAVLFSADGGRLISTGDDGTIRWWSVASGRLLRQATDADWSRVMALTADGRTLVLATDSGKVKVRDAETGALVPTRAGHAQKVRGVAIAPHGKTIASAGNDGTVRVADVATGVEMAVMRCETALTGVAYSPDGRALAAGGYDGRVRVWGAKER